MRNSPLVKRKAAGGYQVLDSEKKDPFVKGITFNVQYYASAEVKDNHNTPAVQETVSQVCEETRKNSKQLRKSVLTIKAHCLTVTDVATKEEDSYPIFLVAYCGGHGDMEDCFYFIHKTKLERTMRVEVFKCSNSDKVKAITVTVAKAFNISYKAWQMEKKKRERAKNGKSPPTMTKVSQQPGKANLTKIAPGVATGGTFTPPAPRKPPSGSGGGDETAASTGRARSGSFGDKPVPLRHPAVTRSQAVNEVTGSTHNVTLTEDFDEEFQELAESRTRPEVLRTSYVEEDTGQFSLDKIMAYMDIADNTEN